MNTAFLLLAQYNAAAVIPVDVVCRDYFGGMTVDKFMRKVTAGEINLPIVRTDPGSQKSAKGVALIHLAQYLDERIAAAEKDQRQLTG